MSRLSTAAAFPDFDAFRERLADQNDLERLRLALIASGEAVFDWTLDAGEIWWSENAAEVLDVAADAAPRRIEDFHALISTRTRKKRDLAIAAARDKGSTYSVEYSFQGTDDEPALWLEERGVCLYAGDDDPFRIIGTVRRLGRSESAHQDGDASGTLDDLTGQLNRTHLLKILSAEIKACLDEGRHLSFLALGIDNLAMINETYGFDVADEVIVDVCRCVNEVLDTPVTIGRVGGNKFGLLLRSCNRTQMNRHAERLLTALRARLIATRAGQMSVTASIGGVTIPEAAMTSQDAMVRAEQALDYAKGHGRDCFFAYDPSPERESLRRRSAAMSDEITSALAEDRVHLYYQPIASTRTRKLVQYESLIRITNRQGETIPAGMFVPVAEQLGLVRLLDQRVLELAIAKLRQHPDLQLAINVSSLTIHDSTWLRLLLELIDADPTLSRRLTVEITETLALHDMERSKKFVARLRDIGTRVAIDDFGAGYTSFRNLQILDVDQVKIDGSFIRGLTESRDSQLFVRLLVELARNFGVSTVAEWVEHEEEIQLLRDLGVDNVQGFYIGRPAPEPVDPSAAPGGLTFSR